jgi:hypothetical protein
MMANKTIRRRIAVGYAELTRKDMVRLRSFKNLGDQRIFVGPYDVATIAKLLGLEVRAP